MKNYSILSDVDLLISINEKDQLAFQELYNRYWDKIFVVCHNRIQLYEVAQDLVQDIFLSIWTHKNVLTIENIEAYLYQSTKYAVIKYLQRASKIEHVETDKLGELEKLHALDISDALHSKMLQQLLFQEVQKLPARTKVIFEYSRIDHLDSKEIAERLQISPRTVENQISQALSALRKFLKNMKMFMIF